MKICCKFQLYIFHPDCDSDGYANLELDQELSYNEENFNETVLLKQMRFDCFKLTSSNGEKPVNPGSYRWIRIVFNKELFLPFLPTSIEIIATSEVNAYGKNFDIWNHGRTVLPSLITCTFWKLSFNVCFSAIFTYDFIQIKDN